MKKKILIIYSASKFPIRLSRWNHLYSFAKYSSNNIYYLNFLFSKNPWYCKKIQFDIVIFDHSITAPWVESTFLRNLESLKKLDFKHSIKVAFFQDEFFRTNLLCKFINEMDIEHVFSVAPKSEWKKIYHDVDFNKVSFHKVLTGYIEEDTLRRTKKLEKKIKRTIDIGYRTVWDVPYHLGKHGLLKTQIASIFQNKAYSNNLKTDISIKWKDNISGFKWFKFLLSCKYTVGVLSGASMLDKDGAINARIQKYLSKHPVAGFTEVEEHCFSGIDGNLNLLAVSPRHLEACITKTCQILMEGDYEDILKPGIHYIELKKDFSNLNEILDIIKRDDMRHDITGNAYNDIVESKKYLYRNYVNFVFDSITQGQKMIMKASKWDQMACIWALLMDKIYWFACFSLSQ
ncbi:MAG: hypothetical protein SV375_01820, partial [Thermodesulfobacteriota bacterium]|nr:hypothetical protein [Thermodesulfobacteriota bacterium]